MFNLYEFFNTSRKQSLRLLSALVFLPISFQTAQTQSEQTAQSLAPCVCTNCPQFMPDGFTGNFYIQVQNASNPTLGQNGQGVCGVRLYFDHEYLGDLQITLTSPAGQSVTLVGPIGFFGPTDFTVWDVLFVPCGDAASPDPGFANTWHNNQPWGLFGTYTGSYYPAGGCLENFNTGPVNGQWTLTVIDGQAVDVGNFFNYEIIFCDPAGIDCFSCAANAGNLLQPDVNACEGSPTLALNLPPTYTPPNAPPPAGEYSYTYVIAGPGGVIQAFDPAADLSGFQAGNYTVCGMSYLTAHEGDIPQPNGSLTIAQLSTQLNSSSPPFCGKITTNCVNVVINPLPEDVEETQTICAPQCYVFYNQSYCQSGTYVRNLVQNGCPYTATLYLTVFQPNFVNITETICPGGCSQTPGFEDACSPGNHTETFTNAAGCDSTVSLNLIEVNVLANIVQPPPEITCSQTTVQLQGTGSTVGGATYLWTASNGGNIVGSPNGINVNVNAPGDYQLRVCRTTAGTTCCDSTSVTVTSNQVLPDAPTAINGPAQICTGQTATFSIDPVAGATTYNWTVPAGVTITSGQGTNSINVTWNSSTSGSICVSAGNPCGFGPVTCFPVDILLAPIPTTPQGLAVVCAGNTANYSIPTVTGAASYNWTVTAPATISSGQGTTNIIVNWGNAPTGDVCVNVGSNCGTSQDVCLSVQINAVPAAPVVTGNNAPCAGSTQTYTVTAVTGATTYNWQVTGGTITSGNGTTSVQVTWDAGATSGSVCAITENDCGESAQNCFTVTLGTAPAAPDISGDGTLCAGTNGSYSIASIAGATGYTWTVPAGGTILSGQNTTAISVAWSGAPGGNVCVAAESGCGTGPQDCFPVVVDAVPVANAGADGAVCGTSFNLQATPSVPGSSGVWTMTSGSGTASFSNANAASTAVDVTLNGTYVFQWTETNGNCTDDDEVTVNFNELPTTGAVTYNCDGTNDNYTVSFSVSGGTAPYTIPGGTVTSGTFTSVPIPSGQNYTFTITDTNGCTASPVTGSFNCDCATDAGQMSLQELTACEGNTISAQHLGGQNLDANDVAAYVLHTNSGTMLGTVLAQNTTGIFGFQVGMNYGTTYYVSFVVGNNLNGQPDPADPCLSVAPGQPVIFYQNPIVNAGADIDTCGLTLTLNGSATIGTGQWTFTGTGLTLSDVQNPTATATATAPGTFTLTWSVTENGCADNDVVEIQFNESPTLADLVRICDAANENFTVTLTISGGTSPYSVNGVSVAGNTFTSTPFPNGQSYNFAVVDANGCTMPVITGAFSCNCTTNAGVMQADTLKVCEGATVTVSANSIAPTLDANDVTAYVLHSGSGPALGQVFDQNTTGIFAFQNGMNFGQTYFVSIVAGNNMNGLPDPADPCFAVAAGQPVVFLKIPTPNAGADDATCGQTINLQAVGGGFTGNWSQVLGPGTAVFSANNDPASAANAPVFGTYIFQWTETNGACVGTDEVNITFNELPSVSALNELCNGANTEFTVTFTAAGGLAPYTIAGLNGSFTGADFTSLPLANNSTYSFVVTDANGCESPAVSGVENCLCATDAGSFQASGATFCATDAATGVWNNDAVLDANDIVQFILHDQSGASVGTVFATNTQPSFDFMPGLQTGVTYYISAIAGNNLAGVVDLNDPCLSVTPGVPVQWKPLPDASLVGDATICNGGSATLTFSGTGVFPLTLTYTDGAGAQNTLTINNQQPVVLPVSPTATATFTLISVSDGTAPTCSTQLNETTTVTVNQPVSAGFANEPLELCAGVALPLQLINFLTDADFGGQWAETSAVPSLPGAFNAATGTFETAGQPAGEYTFRYLLTAQPPCPNDEEIVTVRLLAPPIADAGDDLAINCEQASVLLGSTNTSSGPGIQYEWLLGNDTVGSTEQIFVGVPGDYTLIVTNAAGCSATDAANVILDNEPSTAEVIAVKNVRCFGERNGSIVIDSINATHPPVLYALNGGTFGPTPVFAGLESGTYTLTLLDANGCEWTSPPITINEPPELKVELGSEVQAALGDSVYLKALISVPSSALDTILWRPLLDTVAAGQDFQHFLPLQSWQVDVMVTDSNGCVAMDKVLVRVDRRRNIYVPNIFNPESTLDPILRVYGGRDVVEIEMFRIYDRWGGQVFEARGFQPNSSVGWEGKHQDKLVSPGVYVYYVVARFIDGEREIFKGDVTVYR